ncbi:VWA domain-containing protein [Flavilitoribacter nigricans]|uniref:VWFA domain-containing protein n=1 Tax=Flavilitoribacter nigricans (strain ATCC 23147 / DSM 23189 / NBRC 102662 / NCIMB 1420 / SS-2) TaxID=1122177 RepID=A0A2D0MZX4_FLAN2|nr:VWA domain-containing protein [Flavilitoribacter nigricans]PHN01730.1 hypothetical protein CRP01_35890 [Flavilitoribacter nigricans DSM 23189 = NBRC 102662]
MMMKTTLFRRIRNGLLLFFLTLVTPFFLSAGSGSIVPAPPNAAGIKGLMNFTVNFRYVPTAADITDLQNALRVANDVICDATDGQIVFGTVTITSGAVNEAQADIWVLPDPGRSGVSFWSDGSGFGRNGSHINLFSNGIEGRVIAHELGHLAFGLGDEYDEQCRWGGPCGIGPAIDPADVDDRNNTLMANHLTMSELTVAANHDPLVGDGSGCPDTETCTDMGLCTGDACTGYNGSTGRYEASQHTLMHAGKSDWEILDQNYSALGLTVPALPTAAPPADCRGFLSFDVQTEGSSLVVLAFDRSGSMQIQDVGDRTRLQFAQAAGRAFVDLQQNKNIDLGIVSFSSTATTNRSVEDLTPANASSFKANIDALVPGGNTAIGDGLIESRVQLQIAQAIAEAGGETLTNPTVFLLSDGQNNRGADPDAVADNLISAGVTIHSIPVGNGADTDLLAELASESGGQMLPAYSDDMIPAIYAELAAHQQGYSLINSSVGFEEHIFFEFPSPSMVIDLPVEKGSDVLTIFLGLKQIEKINIENENIGRSVDLVDPNGNKVPDSQFSIINDAFYRILHIQNPQPGNYKLYVLNSQLTTADLNVVSFLENPLPDFYIDAVPSIIDAPQPIMISGMASFGVTLFDPNIKYEGLVIRPDRSTVPVNLNVNMMTGAVATDFNSFNGGGTYTVIIKASVPRLARLTPGESIFESDTEYSIDVDDFVRVASTSFILNTPGSCGPCDNKDCDGDGIPNEFEDAYPDQDPDNDGIPNSCDEDSDGDDIPDAQEQDFDLNQNGVPDVYEWPEGLACNEDSEFEITDVVVEEPDCDASNGAISIKVKGAKGKVSYRWSHDPKLDKAKAGDLPAFIYAVTAIDETGCERTATINLTEDCTSFTPVGDLPVIVSCPGEIPQGCVFPVTVTVDLTGAVAPDDRLGSFTGVMTWNPTSVEYVGPADILSGFNGFINLDAANGRLIFNGANSAGIDGIMDIFRAKFQAIGPVGTTDLVKVQFLSFAAANTFTDLIPELALQMCEFEITPAGILGDVNGDGIVTSTDGNIILSADAGISLPPAIQEIVDNGFGDVNQDGVTNATDALIVLTYDAQLPVPYPVGEAFCPSEKASDFLGLDTRNVPVIDVHLRPQPVADHEQWVNLTATADLTQLEEKLGSYKAVITWDPNALSLLRHTGGHTAGFGSPTVNDREVNEGKLVITHANANGMSGLINLFHLQFENLREGGLESLKVHFENMATADTFEPLQVNIPSAADLPNLPAEVSIFPNPFTDRVQLAYELPEAANVQITVHNLMGQQLATVASGPRDKGAHRLEWRTSDVPDLSSGLLLFKVKMGETVITKRVMYVRKGK